VEIYERIEARLIELEQRTGELERKLLGLEELIKCVDQLERKLKILVTYSTLGDGHV